MYYALAVSRSVVVTTEATQVDTMETKKEATTRMPSMGVAILVIAATTLLFKIADWALGDGAFARIASSAILFLVIWNATYLLSRWNGPGPPRALGAIRYRKWLTFGLLAAVVFAVLEHLTRSKWGC